MSATPWVAWVGACTGVASLAWNIYTKLTSGPKLRVTAVAGMVMMPPPPNNPRFLKVTVQNNGSAPTTITNLCFHRYDSWWSKIKRRSLNPSGVLNHFRGPQFPHKLEVGTEWSALMEQDASFDEWLRSDILWCAVIHSFSKRPTQVKIFRVPD
jgi:hypothetical protein